jgi:hypothetical protein
LKRHISKYCKIKTLQVCSNNSQTNTVLTQKVEEQQQLINQLIEALKTQGNTNISNCNNTNIQNIQINGFGNEDISFLTDGKKLMICDSVYGSVGKCIEVIHMDDQRPENKTIRIKSRKRNEVEKYNGKKQKWEVCDMKESMKELIEINFNRVNEFYNEDGIRKKMTSNKVNRFDQFVDDVEGEEPEVIKRLEDDVKKLIKNFD